jgi:hypothetical protein
MVCAWQEKFHGDENESLLCTTFDCVFNFLCKTNAKSAFFFKTKLAT